MLLTNIKMSNLHIHSILQDVSLGYIDGYLITQGYKYSVNQRDKINCSMEKHHMKT
jgi:hypothetical protein